jgi:two-component system CheB/CheR fusion protein
MAREGLLHGLQTALYAARKTDAPVRKDGPARRVHGHGRATSTCRSSRSRSRARAATTSCSSRTSAGGRGRGRGRAVAGPAGAGDDERVRQLQDELAASREYLQSIIQDLEAANEELQSANEEILSSNEELQSTNEELDTAKEELQSTNEELNTVNEELHGRNDELSRVNSDLINLLGCVEIAIVIVGADLGIRRFTPMAEKVLNLIPTDIGRPISQIKPDIECPGLEKLIARVIDTVTIHEMNVRDSEGNWYSLRIRPYKNVENRIDGAVLALFDIASRRQDGKHRQARDHARAVLDTVPVPVVVLDGQLRVQRINRPFSALFQVAADGAVHRCIYDLHGGRWGGPRLRALLEEVLPHEGRVDGYRIDGAFPGVPAAIVSAGRIDGEDDATIVLVLQDVAQAR